MTNQLSHLRTFYGMPSVPRMQVTMGLAHLAMQSSMDLTLTLKAPLLAMTRPANIAVTGR